MKPLKTKVSITLDTEIVDRIRTLAEEDDRSFSQYVNLVLKKFLYEKIRMPDLPQASEFYRPYSVWIKNIKNYFFLLRQQPKYQKMKRIKHIEQPFMYRCFTSALTVIRKI